jgi:hypothetical protein
LFALFDNLDFRNNRVGCMAAERKDTRSVSEAMFADQEVTGHAEER